MADETEQQQERIGKLQAMEHNLHGLDQQRQQLQAQLFEIESAIEALGSATSAYKIVGSVMVSTEPAAARKELEQKKEVLDVRIQSMEKQEEKLRENAKALQEQVLGALKK